MVCVEITFCGEFVGSLSGVCEEFVGGWKVDCGKMAAMQCVSPRPVGAWDTSVCARDEDGVRYTGM